MRLTDYLIDQNDLVWAELLRPWRWLLPAEFTVWMVNRFAELILVFEDGSVHYLAVGDGELKQIAENREDFFQKIDEGDNANDWLMIPLVDHCVDAGLPLSPGECYAFRQLPVLGGDYTVDNVIVAKLAGYHEYAAIIHERIRDYPDGTKVVIKVVE